MEFLLLNKDTPVLCFSSVNIGNMLDFSISKVYNESLIPRNMRNLYKWVIFICKYLVLSLNL